VSLELVDNEALLFAKRLEIGKIFRIFATLKWAKNKQKLTFVLIYCQEIGTN
jgi:hypothetical protein